MRDFNKVAVKVYGDFALFTIPPFSVERFSYPLPTPSAARGILESIYWKPEFSWDVKRISIINPLRQLSMIKKELQEVQQYNKVTMHNRTLRMNVVYVNVSYIIEASVSSKKEGTDEERRDDIKKHVGMFDRRTTKGQCRHQPYFGIKDYSAYFSRAIDYEAPIEESFEIKHMFFDFDYSNENRTPLFFDAKVNNGVLDCPALEEVKKCYQL